MEELPYVMEKLKTKYIFGHMMVALDFM